MENAFLATKVAFANQFYDLARAAGVDYEDVRRLFLLDERVGASHTEVHPERGFGGRCLPKDMKSIVAWARPRADATLLEDVLEYNDRLRERAAGADESCAAAS
jgi:UDP-glucose 6-dehydrogenase